MYAGQFDIRLRKACDPYGPSIVQLWQDFDPGLWVHGTKVVVWRPWSECGAIFLNTFVKISPPNVECESIYESTVFRNHGSWSIKKKQHSIHCNWQDHSSKREQGRWASTHFGRWLHSLWHPKNTRIAMEMAWATRVDLENHVPLFEQRGLDSLLLNGLRSAKPCLSQKPYHRTGCFPTPLAEQTGKCWHIVFKNCRHVDSSHNYRRFQLQAVILSGRTLALPAKICGWSTVVGSYPWRSLAF